MTDIDEIFSKYRGKLEKNLTSEKIDVKEFSREFKQFKSDMSPELSKYEKWCRGLGNIIKIKIAKKDEDKLQKHLDIAHLDVTPGQTLGLAIVSLFLIFLIGIIIFLVNILITGNTAFLILLMTLLISLFLFYYLYSMPYRIAKKWRLKASSQMVPAVLYVVAYMKHTSNLERAIVFASKHLQPPLALDFRKIFWDLETGKFSTLKESLENYLDTWRDDNIEFVESFHLIESSLYEPSETRRVQILERALQVILDGVYDRMLKYARDVRSPLTNVYMLGIVLPTLGIALIPLASTLLQGVLKWYHLILLFNFLIPFFVFYMTSEILLKRPGGYGQKEAVELNPNYNKFTSKKPYFIAGLIALPLLLLGLLPFIFQYTGIPGLIGMPDDFKIADLGIGASLLGDTKFFDFISTPTGIKGPFGVPALFLSLLIPLGIGLFFSISYNLKTKEIIKSRQDSEKLEKEFTNSLFQLGNRLGDGVPAEIAFAHIADSTRGQVTEGFFQTVNTNIHQQGMSLEQAIFDKRRGAIIYYPSALISTSMKILVESVKKGLIIAARSLMSISDYIKNIEKINERMRDMLAEVISDMKSNMTFLAPLLAGIVVGLGAMIVNILGKLEGLIAIEGQGALVDLGSTGDIFTTMFNLEFMIPPYFLQIAIGIYIIEIIFILSNTLVTIDAGEDKLKKIYETGKNLNRGVIFYIIVTSISVFALSLLALIATRGFAG